MIRSLFLAAILPFSLLARDWTVMVYMAADNDLSAWADSDIVEMRAAGFNDDIAVILQLDKPAAGAQRLQIASGSVFNLGDLGIIDMCDPSTLSDFLEWTVREFPADRYLAVLWDHGTGWTAAPRRTFGSDNSGGSQMSIAGGELREALQTAYDATGEKLDIIAFDACLMQQTEICHEVKDFAKIMLAPQTNWPIAGFPYQALLQDISGHGGDNEKIVAASIVGLCADHYAAVQPAAISAVALDRIDELADRTSSFYETCKYGIPGQGIRAVREAVQTIPFIGSMPSPDDDIIDLGDLADRMKISGVFSAPVEDLLETYAACIVSSRSWGIQFTGLTGLDIWFPYHYLQFKQLSAYYRPLTWNGSRWQSFLNWFYDQDDVRPESTAITEARVDDNNFRLCWSRSYDLADVDYIPMLAGDTSTVFHDDAEDSSGWLFDGFALSAANVHSGSFSFFSGNASSQVTSITTAQPITLLDPGLLILFMDYATEDMTDSIVITAGARSEVFYGISGGWKGKRIVLPAGTYDLRIEYRTNAGMNFGGCYVDDITVLELTGGRELRAGLSDTTILVFNQVRGDFLAAVEPLDAFGNRGNLSAFYPLSIAAYAVPYSLPNPFHDGCTIVLDYPDTLRPSLKIFSINGRLVKQFAFQDIQDRRVEWDGRDSENRQVGAGLYFIVLQDKDFTMIGKIARQT